IAGSSRETQIKITKGFFAPASSNSKSKCLNKSLIKEADKQISSANKIIEIKYDDLEELE
ncbi:2503_t:CDS:1, partial [Funneliformis geosporum]